MTWTNALKNETTREIPIFIEYVQLMNVLIAFYHSINAFREPMYTRVI